MPRFCPECDASNPKDARFCELCGAELAQTSGEPESVGEGGEQTGASSRREALDRLHASRELGRARRALERVRNFYLVLAIASGLGTALFGFLALRLAGTEGAGLLWVLTGLQAAVTALLVVGLLRVRKNPFLWSLVLAAVQTLSVTVSLAFGDGIPWLGILLAVGCWSAVSLLAGVNALVARHPELRATRRLRGERFTREGGPGRIARREFERRAARRRRLWTAVGVAGGVVVAVVAFLVLRGGSGGSGSVRAEDASYRRQTRLELEPDQPLEPFVQRFETAWRARSLEAIGGLYAARLARRGSVARLRQRFEKHGMLHFPELGRPKVRDRSPSKKEILYETIDGPVTVVAEFDGERWAMVALRF